MNWLRLSPLIALGLVNIVIAGLVWARDFRRLNNRAFAGFAFAIGIWIIGIAGFLLSNGEGASLAWARIYYFAPLLIAVSGYYFAESFPTTDVVKSKIRLPFLLGFLSLTGVLLFFPSSFMHALEYRSWGKEVILNQPVYAVYTLYIVVSFSTILWIMYLKAKRLQGIYALQAKLFFQTLTVTAIFGLLFNLILPLLHNYRLIGLGPLFTSISVVGIAYSIRKHRMFDVRLIVVRSLAYGLSLTLITVMYGLISYGLSTYIFANLNNHSIEIVLNILLLAAAAVSFAPLKTQFDKLTNKYFYRDAYDAQELFSQLNRALVSSLNTKYLMMQSISIIETALKPEFTLIGLRDGDEAQRLFMSKKLGISEHDIFRTRKLTPHFHHKVIVADYIDGQKHTELRELMIKNKIAVIVRLTQNLRSNEDGLGYLVLGAKKSGNPYTQQDIRVLDTVGDELIIAIQNALHYEEIQQFNLVLQKRIDEATRKLRRTNEKLKALDETKDDFISMASHQLRTPLTSVKGYLSMVIEGDAGKVNATQEKMLAQAFTSSQRMVYLIADLLNVSRLRTGKFVIEPAPTNLAVMIEEELAQLVEAAKARDLELTFAKPKDFPELMLDETKTRQVVMNFIDNAIYYTPSGGHIKVELHSDDKLVELRVVDDGIGVPKAEQHHLFTKFYRAGNARKARPDGTGLGLFMAKKVIIAQGGSVIFESIEGKGSVFGFRFSRSKLAPQALPSATSAIEVARPPTKNKT